MQIEKQLMDNQENQYDKDSSESEDNEEIFNHSLGHQEEDYCDCVITKDFIKVNFRGVNKPPTE